MMKKLMFVCLLGLILFQSCKKEEIPPTKFTCLEENETEVITNDCIENWMCSFKVFPESIVDKDKDIGYVSGDKQVFKMDNSTEGSLQIVDDENTEILIFELEESQNNFSVEDSELANLKVHYARLCYCSFVFEYKLVESGCMQGEKQEDGTWQVQGSLNLPTPFEGKVLKFDAQFSK